MHCGPYDAPMPTKNPRLTITITPELQAQLRRLSALTGQSQAGLISELLHGSGGIFDRVITVLEAAEEARWSIQGALTEDMRQAQQRIEVQLGLDLALQEAGAEVMNSMFDEQIKRRARKGSAGAPAGRSAQLLNPLSNRGVRSEAQATKNPTRTRG